MIILTFHYYIEAKKTLLIAFYYNVQHILVSLCLQES